MWSSSIKSVFNFSIKDQTLRKRLKNQGGVISCQDAKHCPRAEERYLQTWFLSTVIHFGTPLLIGPKSDYCLALSVPELSQSVSALVETWLIWPWCVNFLQPCCRRWNKTKSMLLMPEQSQTHVFINFYLTQPSPMVGLPKGQFGQKRLQHQQFFAYRLHCIRLCHPNKIYLLLTYYMLVVRLDWYDPGEDSPLLSLLYRILPNQTSCKLQFVPSFEGRVLLRFWS